MRTILCFAFTLLNISILQAQPKSDSTGVVFQAGLKVHHGSIIIHSRSVRAIEDSYPWGVEFNLTWHNLSQKAWESCNCYPKVGLSIGLWDFDNPDVLGQALAGIFYLEPVFGAQNRLSFSVWAGFGLFYKNNPHDPEDNPDNLSYSTHLAFPLQLGGNVHWRLNDQWQLDGTAVFNHISNGGIKEPNKGVNWPTMALGASYYLQPVVSRNESGKISGS